MTTLIQNLRSKLSSPSSPHTERTTKSSLPTPDSPSDHIVTTINTTSPSSVPKSPLGLLRAARRRLSNRGLPPPPLPTISKPVDTESSQRKAAEETTLDRSAMGNQVVACIDEVDEEVKPSSFQLLSDSHEDQRIEHCPKQNKSVAPYQPTSPSSKYDQQMDRSSAHSISSKSSSSSKASILKRRIGKGARIVFKKLQQAAEFILFEHDDDSNDHNHLKQQKPRRVVRGGVLLHGCDTPEEHFEKYDAIMAQIKQLHGTEGLAKLGLEFRSMPCVEHEQTQRNQDATSISFLRMSTMEEEKKTEDDGQLPAKDMVADTSSSTLEDQEESIIEDANNENSQHHEQTTSEGCVTRLYHVESGTLIEISNRRSFISDGEMYDEVARLCMEHVHQHMCQHHQLEWITVEQPSPQDSDNDSASLQPPVRALISSSYDASKPTLLICTGKGKVRAGIFSRQHLITTGLEQSTALSQIQQAQLRGMNIVLLDPNARGERVAMDVIEASMAKLFAIARSNVQNHQEQQQDMYIQAHSAAGSHIVLYLLKQWNDMVLNRQLPYVVRSIAFSDSTHCIQWTKNNQHLFSFLESSACMYIKSSNKMRDDDWMSHQPGQAVNCNSFWIHRFGRIATRYAGTTEHSLSDWFARDFVWQHFDKHLRDSQQQQ